MTDARELLRLIFPMARAYAFEHPVGKNKEMVAEAEAYLAQPLPAQECAHEWVSADNEIVQGASICLKCRTITSTHLIAASSDPSSMCEHGKRLNSPCWQCDADAPCQHEWREMRSDSDPYRDDECKFCGIARAEAAPAERPPTEAPPAFTPPAIRDLSHTIHFADGMDDDEDAAPLRDGLEPARDALDVRAWAAERLANSERIAAMKVGADRDGWLEDVAYWREISALQEERDRLRAALRSRSIRSLSRQVAGYVQSFKRCAECCHEWRDGRPEEHEDGCLAAPGERSGERE